MHVSNDNHSLKFKQIIDIDDELEIVTISNKHAWKRISLQNLEMKLK